MNLDNIVIVLDRPEEPRNIGAVCRAMANSNIHELRIVGKKEEIDIVAVATSDKPIFLTKLNSINRSPKLQQTAYAQPEPQDAAERNERESFFCRKNSP